MRAENIIKDLPKGLINWYEFQGGLALYVSTELKNEKESNQKVAYEEALKAAGLEVCSENWESVVQPEFSNTRQKVFDYILMAGALERCQQPASLLTMLHGLLKPKGKLLLGTDNRLGIRYFCGDRDTFTGRNFDSIENYYRINANDMEHLEGRAYSKAEITKMLETAGFFVYRFYSVFPLLTAPQMIYAEDYLPAEELDVRCIPNYSYPDTVFLEEEHLYTSLIQNGLFHCMANGYLIECSLDGCLSNVNHVTLSMERGKEHALATVIRRDDTVVKKALYPEGREKLRQMIEHDNDLRAHGISVVESWLEGNHYAMPYIHGEIMTNYFRRLLIQDKESFYRELDTFWELILRSSEHVAYEEIDWEHFDPEWERRKEDDPERDKWKKLAFGRKKNALGVILKRGYIDLVSLNCFHIDNKFVFYDQEFYVKDFPANTILWRTIDFIYWGNSQMEAILPRKELQERYQLNEHLELWQRFSNHFIYALRNEKELAEFHRLHRRDMEVINSNRQRMNYSENEYQRVFRDIFRNTQGRKIYLFGSGNFTKKFLSQFKGDCGITGILDNNSAKWGTDMEGIPIESPAILTTLREGEYKVIICVKNYIPILKQLKEIGVKNYGIYDWNLEYPRKAPMPVISQEKKAEITKKYHVGYIAGVFDLFHIGHLNMFKRAKELCDYLIVGVVTDESVRKNKKTSPYIPFEERLEMVRSCRFVDEAVEIPTDYGDTDEAYRRYQFDVQFSGSDYANDPEWLAKKVFLEKQGAELVFFPYTEGTSSTKLKTLIEKGLL